MSNASSQDPLEDIRIIDVPKDMARRTDPAKEMYDVYFELSESPPSAWGNLFLAEREFPRHSSWRRARLEGRYIVVHCALSEVKKYHLPDLKEDIRNTNQKFREHLSSLEKGKHLERQRKKEERRRIDGALSDLALD